MADGPLLQIKMSAMSFDRPLLAMLTAQEWLESQPGDLAKDLCVVLDFPNYFCTVQITTRTSKLLMREWDKELRGLKPRSEILTQRTHQPPPPPARVPHSDLTPPGTRLTNPDDIRHMKRVLDRRTKRYI